MQIQLPSSLASSYGPQPLARRSLGPYQLVLQSILQTRRDHPRDYVNAMGREALSRGISRVRGSFFFPFLFRRFSYFPARDETMDRSRILRTRFQSFLRFHPVVRPGSDGSVSCLKWPLKAPRWLSANAGCFRNALTQRAKNNRFSYWRRSFTRKKEVVPRRLLFLSASSWPGYGCLEITRPE